jgi:hypothetical protein
MALNLVGHGAPFVMVANGMNWDNHVFQHEIHQMLVPELDRVLFHLITDLEQRGLLDSTLVIAMGEFGRSPWMNAARGRDHYPNAWSMMMTGCGLKRGIVTGATDEDGVDVAEKPYDEQNLFATIFSAWVLIRTPNTICPACPHFIAWKTRRRQSGNYWREDHEAHTRTSRPQVARQARSASRLTPDAGDTAFAACADGSRSLRGGPRHRRRGSRLPKSIPRSGAPASCCRAAGQSFPAATTEMLLWHDVENETLPPSRQRPTSFGTGNSRCRRTGSQLATTTGQYIPGGWKYEPAAETEPSVKSISTLRKGIKLLASFAHTPPVMSCAFAPDGQHLAAGQHDGRSSRVGFAFQAGCSPPVAQWISPDFTSWGTVKSHHYCGGIYGLAFAPDGKLAFGMRHGPDVRSHGWQRKDDVAALGLAKSREKLDQIKDDQRGAGLMETDCVAPGRRAVSSWRAGKRKALGTRAVFDASDGKPRAIPRHEAAHHPRPLYSRWEDWLVFSGATGQPPRKDGKWPSLGAGYKAIRSQLEPDCRQRVGRLLCISREPKLRTRTSKKPSQTTRRQYLRGRGAQRKLPQPNSKH